MALRIEPQSEVIPGYRLLERLGGGGFGEVWKAQAPGGLMKAIKTVHGDLGAGASGGQRAEQELYAPQPVQELDKLKRDDPPSAGAATTVYAAPETCEGNLSPFCDQYSLAVVYQELLTGKRPFQAINFQQLIAQHLQSAPDLSALPAGDRA